MPLPFLSVVVGVLWAIIIAYWLISAIGVKQNLPGKFSWTRAALARLAFIIVIVIALSIPGVSGDWEAVIHSTLFTSAALRILGTLLTAVGIAFAIWARWHLGRNWSGVPTMKVGHELVTSGPYRFVRHPIYTGIIIGLLGTAFVLGPVWLFIFIVSTIIFIWRIPVEEKYMMELFPDQYPVYRARTKALIPGIW